MLEVTCVVDRPGVYKLAHGENLYVKTCNDELPNVRIYTSEMAEKP